MGIERGIVSDRRVPKIVTGNSGERKTVPSFAGNINIGPLAVPTKSTTTRRPTTTTRRTTTSPQVARLPLLPGRLPHQAPPLECMPRWTSDHRGNQAHRPRRLSHLYPVDRVPRAGPAIWGV